RGGLRQPRQTADRRDGCDGAGLALRRQQAGSRALRGRLRSALWLAGGLAAPVFGVRPRPAQAGRLRSVSQAARLAPRAGGAGGWGGWGRAGGSGIGSRSPTWGGRFWSSPPTAGPMASPTTSRPASAPRPPG